MGTYSSAVAETIYDAADITEDWIVETEFNETFIKHEHKNSLLAAMIHVYEFYRALSYTDTDYWSVEVIRKVDNETVYFADRNNARGDYLRFFGWDVLKGLDERLDEFRRPV